MCPFYGRSSGRRVWSRLRSLPNPSEIRACQQCGRFVSGGQQPRFQFRCRRDTGGLLIADGSKNIVNEIARIRANAFADLLLKKIFNIFSERDFHIEH